VATKIPKLILLLYVLSTSTTLGAGAGETTSIEAAVRGYIRPGNRPTQPRQKVFSYNPSWVDTFYKNRAHAPAWFNEGRLRHEAYDLALAIQDAHLEGLNPADYNRDAVNAIVEQDVFGQLFDVLSVPQFDVVLTDAFLHYASDLHSGRINPRAVNAEWNIRPRKTDLARRLQEALESVGIRQTLRSLLPKHAGYQKLKKALALLAESPPPDDSPFPREVRKLAMGDSSASVGVLRKKLSFWFSGLEVHSEVFDDSLEQTVMEFQRWHGIEPDGIVGKQTIIALNMPREARLQQIRVNLERMRWLPDSLGERYIAVNIPGFELQVVHSDTARIRLRVVVGKKGSRTPLLSGTMTHIVLSPFWHVPDDIAVKEVVPKLLKDSTYLSKENIKVFRTDGKKMTEVNPDSVDWSGSDGSIPYKLRMEPGARNALGRIKFMFANDQNVYLHDTPAKNLFNKTVRQFSHGCVRVENTDALAAYLLARDTSWINEAIQTAHGKGRERHERLPELTNVYLQYFTTWVDAGGMLQFRQDIYEWDSQISRVLIGEAAQRKKTAAGQMAGRSSKGRATASVQ
jgi:murein L,D-transpeptidase YcbB/YkuD